MQNSSFTILVVDDSRAVRFFLGETLEQAGYKVLTAEDGKKGLNVLKRQGADIVISDLEMPVMDGMKFCRIVKEDVDLKGTYFIIYSGRDALKDRVDGLNIGADDYMVKPAFEEELIARINAGIRIKRLEGELKNAQYRIAQSEKMVFIGQLAAGVAHEINNPMGFISSNLSTLRKYVEKLTGFIHFQTEVIDSFNEAEALGKLDEKRKKLKLDYIIDDIKDLLKESLEGSERVRKIVQDLSGFSRVDEVASEYIDINDCLESTLTVLRSSLNHKATVRKDYGGIPLTKCYPHQLDQAFMNLLVNAAHAIEEQGEITIKTWDNDSSIFISISDTGYGIPKENLNRIFEPFFTTKEAGKGVGLGLSITCDIVKMHSGEITVNTEVGKGTTFTLRIPAVK